MLNGNKQSFREIFIRIFNKTIEKELFKAINRNTKDVKKKHYEIIINSKDKFKVINEDASLIVKYVFDRVVRIFRKAKSKDQNLTILFNIEFDDNDYLRDYKDSWKVYVSKRVINGVTNKDRLTLNFLYDYFIQKAENHVKRNSGVADDAGDVLSVALTKFYLICKDEEDNGRTYDHENVFALIMRIINHSWLDMLRSTNSELEKLMKFFESIGVSLTDNENYFHFSNKKKVDKINLEEEFQLSKRFVDQLHEKHNNLDFLDFDKLHNFQKEFIELLIDFGKTYPVGTKIIYIADVLPKMDREILAEEMGYLKSTDSKSKKKQSVETFNSTRSRSLRYLKEYLDNNLNRF